MLMYSIANWASTGIHAVECQASAKPEYVFQGPNREIMKVGTFVFHTLADAEQAMEAKRVAKLASLRRQIAKLEAMGAGQGAGQ